jgi:hypothetical protein
MGSSRVLLCAVVSVAVLLVSHSHALRSQSPNPAQPEPNKLSHCGWLGQFSMMSSSQEDEEAPCNC